MRESKDIKEWLAKAEKDLRAAKINLQQELFDVAAFLAHQAAEKALKALYIKKFRRLWKIHDLEKLCLELEGDEEVNRSIKKIKPSLYRNKIPN